VHPKPIGLSRFGRSPASSVYGPTSWAAHWRRCGAHCELHQRDRGAWPHQDFVPFHPQGEVSAQHIMDRLIKHCRELKGADILDDDFSILAVTLP
jgi:hypothetical protein